MDIRVMKEKDNHTMEHIIKRSLEAFGLDIPGTAYFDPQLGNLYEFYKHQPNAEYWVIVNDRDEVMGGVGIGPFGEKAGIGELQKLYVAPTSQGKGLSRKLMRVALDFAREHYTYCYIETSEKLQVANCLYGKLGFQELDRPLDGSEHGEMDKWYMKLL